MFEINTGRREGIDMTIQANANEVTSPDNARLCILHLVIQWRAAEFLCFVKAAKSDVSYSHGSQALP